MFLYYRPFLWDSFRSGSPALKVWWFSFRSFQLLFLSLALLLHSTPDRSLAVARPGSEDATGQEEFCQSPATFTQDVFQFLMLFNTTSSCQVSLCLPTAQSLISAFLGSQGQVSLPPSLILLHIFPAPSSCCTEVPAKGEGSVVSGWNAGVVFLKRYPAPKWLYGIIIYVI